MGTSGLTAAHRSVIIIISFAVFALGMPFLSQAQETSQDVCPIVAASGLATLGTSCANLDSNNTCYGNDVIGATFRNPLPEGAFDEPGERTDSANVEAVQPRTINLQDRNWGLSVLNIQANVPRTLSNTGLVVIALGGAEVENGIEPAQAFKPLEEGIVVTTISLAEFRPATMTPPADSDVLGTIPAGQSLVADAVSQDGNWIRVVYDGRPIWVARAALSSNVNLSALLLIGPDSFTSMQSFFFRNGIGGQPCNLVPSFLFTQSPSTFPIDVRVHTANIRIQGTVILRTLPPGDQLGDVFEVIVLYGLAIINPDTTAELIVPAGYSTQIALGEFVSLGIEGDADEKLPIGGWSAIRRVTQDELNFFIIVREFTSNLLYNEVEIPVIVTSSGVGGAIPQIVYNDPVAVFLVQQACQANQLSDSDCEYFGF